MDDPSAQTLFVLLGAGASYDAIPAPEPGGRPPLTPELFSHPRSALVLPRYAMAGNAAPQIRDAVAGEEPAVSLEDYLRERIWESSDPYDKKRLLGIELYLQDLLLSFADQADGADSYRRLINPLIARHDHVCFISLNYDILLDATLTAFDPLGEIDDFIAHERWSLIKPHGSVTWGRRIPTYAGPGWKVPSVGELFSSPPANLADVLDEQIVHRWTLDLDQVRSDDALDSLGLFPALSVPLGPEDRVVCPGSHLDFLAERLERTGAYDLLVIGYSGLDRSVLGLLTGTSAKPRSVYVVDADFEAAVRSAERLASAFGDSVAPVKRINVQLAQATVDVEGQGPIKWHADDSSFSEWAPNGPADHARFVAEVR